MRYAIETEGGVDLLVGTTPLPEGAIEPVPNWEEMIIVPPYYRKLVDGQVIEMTQEEKDIYDATHPPSIEEEQGEAQAFLEETDWYVIRKADPSSGKDVPQDILDARSAAREIL